MIEVPGLEMRTCVRCCKAIGFVLSRNEMLKLWRERIPGYVINISTRISIHIRQSFSTDFCLIIGTLVSDSDIQINPNLSECVDS